MHGFFCGADASGFYCQRGRWVICIIGKGTRSFNAMRGVYSKYSAGTTWQGVKKRPSETAQDVNQK
jgi:hypothetical protein